MRRGRGLLYSIFMVYLWYVYPIFIVYLSYVEGMLRVGNREQGGVGNDIYFPVDLWN